MGFDSRFLRCPSLGTNVQAVSEMCALDLGLDFEMPSDLQFCSRMRLFLENARVVSRWDGALRWLVGRY